MVKVFVKCFFIWELIIGDYKFLITTKILQFLNLFSGHINGDEYKNIVGERFVFIYTITSITLCRERDKSADKNLEKVFPIIHWITSKATVCGTRVTHFWKYYFMISCNSSEVFTVKYEIIYWHCFSWIQNN